MVTASGFASAPVTRFTLLLLVSSSIGASIFSLKPYLPLKVTPHLWPYLQLWRTITFPLAHTSSTDLLWSSALLYQLRPLERLWGSRKFASFLLATYTLTTIGIVSLGVLLKILTLGWWSFIPAGPTSIIIALLAVWRHKVPRLGGFKILLDDDPVKIRNGTARGLDVSDKWTVYLLGAQLALSQSPWSLVPAGVGWVVGNAWVEELVPGALVRWRVAPWFVGEDGSGRRGERFEGLRRRLEEEGGDGMREVASGRSGRDESEREERRGGLGGLGRYFTGGS